MNSISLKKRRFYFYALIVVFFMIIPVITLYTSGYRMGDNFKLVETGGIYILSPEQNAEIYINNKKRKETSMFQKDLFVQNLKPGKYTVLISKKEFWPWAKEVEVEERKVTEAIAFLIPKNLRGDVIQKKITIPADSDNATTTKINIEYKKISDLFKKQYPDNKSINKLKKDKKTSDTKKDEVTSKRGRVKIWLSKDNQVIANWTKDADQLPNYFCRKDICNGTVTVFKSVEPVKSLSFYPGREDVVLIAISNGIFAIEIDARKNQNFQPVYKGIDPYFIIDDGTIYIKDNDTLLKLYL